VGIFYGLDITCCHHGVGVRAFSLPPRSPTVPYEQLFLHTVPPFTASLKHSSVKSDSLSASLLLTSHSCLWYMNFHVSGTLMFLKCSSVNRHPPSLLSGFHGADLPPFYSTMRMLRLPSPVSLPSVSLGSDTNPISPFLCAGRVAISTLQARIVRVRSIPGIPTFGWKR
jgi:hypothetical protein